MTTAAPIHPAPKPNPLRSRLRAADALRAIVRRALLDVPLSAGHEVERWARLLPETHDVAPLLAAAMAREAAFRGVADAYEEWGQGGGVADAAARMFGEAVKALGEIETTNGEGR